MSAGLWYRNGTYYTNLIDPNGEKIRKSLDTGDEEKAKIIVERMQMKFLEQKFGLQPIINADIKFSELVTEYTELVKHKRSFQDSIRYVIFRLNRRFGETKAANLNKAIVEDYMMERLREPISLPEHGRHWDKERQQKWLKHNKKTIAPSSVNKEVRILNAILNKAVARKLIPSNPIKGITLFDEKSGIRKRFLSKSEIKALRKACAQSTSKHLSDVVDLALYLGRRRGEIIGIKWVDVNLENGYLTFPKTKKGEPDQVPIPQAVREILNRRSINKSLDFVFPNEKAMGATGGIRTAFRTACLNSGIKTFRFHDLRHTAISYMVMTNIDRHTIAALVGHTSPQMIDKRYGHLSPEHKKASVETFGSVMDELTKQ